MSFAAFTAAAALLIVVATWAAYLATVPAGKVPARPIGSIASQILGVALALAALAWDVASGAAPSPLVIAPSATALTAGGLFLYLLTQRETPIGELRVAVGDALLPFRALRADGTDFHTGSLAGSRVLLKFFRGSW